MNEFLEAVENITDEQIALGNTHHNNLPGWSIFGKKQPGRQCGHCNFCCIVVPVAEPLHKPGGVKCVHLKHKGCSIYKQRPDVCAAWQCAWLYQPEAKILKRPDLSGYAVDCCLGDIFLNQQSVRVIQVWVDPDRREAHRAPELRAYLAEMARIHGLPAMVRWPDKTDHGGEMATVLFAPCMTDNGEWGEISSNMIPMDEMNRLRKERT